MISVLSVCIILYVVHMCINIKSIQYTCNKNKYNTLKNSSNPKNTHTVYHIMKIKLCEVDLYQFKVCLSPVVCECQYSYLSNNCPIITIRFKLITLWTAWFVLCTEPFNTSFSYCAAIVIL